jgi:sulfur-oxidizing protein SoxZ
MKDTIKLRVRLDGDLAQVKCLVSHPMETGQRKDSETGRLIPRHHIKQLVFANNGKLVMVANCSTAVARNPYFDFSVRGVAQGDRFSVSWEDTEGERDSLEIEVG